MIQPIRIVHLLPNLSPTGPASPAPQNAPPVKKETTMPLRVFSLLSRMLSGREGLRVGGTGIVEERRESIRGNHLRNHT